MKVTLAGLYMPGSGLTSVLMHLARYIAERAHVSLLAFDPRPGIARNLDIAGLRARMISVKGGRMTAEVNWLTELMLSDHPDFFLVTGPVFMARTLLEQLSPYRPKLRVAYYLPAEGSIVSKSILDLVGLTDDCVLFTECARRDLVRLLESEPRTSTPMLHVIGHGVDQSVFCEMGLRENISARHTIRQSFWPTEDPEEFVVLNVNRPYYRKRLDISIAGFGEFSKKHPRSRLVFHIGSVGKERLAELEHWKISSGAADKITFLPGETLLSAIRLNELYNICDVGLTTAMGEGWGLTPFEHASTGAPQIVPDHTSFSENWRGAASMLPIVEQYPVFYEYSHMHVTSPRYVASALEELAHDIDLRREMGIAAKTRAHNPALSWDKVGSRFFEILNPKVPIPSG